MLEIRPNCEYCDKDLPVTANDACICTYECTFCQSCVDNILHNVCPNCGGGFSQRPIRPKRAYRKNTSLQYNPASVDRVNTKYAEEEIIGFIQKIKDILPENR